MPSETVKVKTLRGAIERGEIEPGWKGKNLFVTRKMIRGWLEKCQDQGTQTRNSSSTRPATTRPGGSRAKPTGMSMTRDGRSPTTSPGASTSEDLARETLKQLRQRAGFTSRRNTPRT